MKRSTLIVLTGVLAACSTETPMEYPETKKVDTSDVYFGTTVADPYRWLENDTAADTEAWVKAQNMVTQAYLETIPYRQQIEHRLTELIKYPTLSPLLRAADY